MTSESEHFDKFNEIQFVSGTDVSKIHCQTEMDEAFRQGLFTTESLVSHVYKDTCFVGKTSGQDYKISLIPKDYPNDLLLGVFDGHGENGHFYSQFTAKLLAKQFLLEWKQLRLLLEGEKEVDVKQRVNQLYNHVDQVLQEMSKTNPYITRCSGTTASLLAIMDIKGERYLLASNLGDSEMIIEEINRQPGLPDFKIKQPVDVLHKQHNCDNIEAVNEYLEYTYKQGVKPLPIYYSRINCPGACNPIWPQISDENGKPCPLPVYEYHQETQKASPDLTSYEKISQFFPDGQQTRRRPPNYTRADGRVVVKSGYEGQNWGNSLNGTIQLLKSFGDYNLDPHINRQPNISIRTFKEGYIALSSDGFGDLFRSTSELMSNLSHIYEETVHPAFPADLSCFYEKVEELVYGIAESDEMYGVKSEGTKYRQGLAQPKRLPKWDDWSLIFHYLPRLEKSRLEKSRLENNTEETSISIRKSSRNRHAPTVYTPSFKGHSYTESQFVIENHSSSDKSESESEFSYSESESESENENENENESEIKKEIPWVLDRWWDNKHFYYKYSWRQAEILNWNPQNSQLNIHFTGWQQESDMVLYLDRPEDRKRFISDGTLLNEIQLKKSGPSLSRVMPNGEVRLSGPIYNTKSKEYFNGEVFLSQSQIEKCHYYQSDLSNSNLSNSELSTSSMSIDDEMESIPSPKQQKRPTKRPTRRPTREPTRQSQRIYNKRKNKITSDMLSLV